jgi:hypothetical protein
MKKAPRSREHAQCRSLPNNIIIKSHYTPGTDTAEQKISGSLGTCYISVGQIPNHRPDVSKLGQITGRQMNKVGRIGLDVK